MGNDVVDLRDPENIGKCRDERFLGRVFTAGERTMIASAPSPDALLWSLWAAKEAAYKAISRDDPAVCSIPRRYPVAFDAGNAVRAGRKAVRLEGRVITPRGDLALEVSLSAERIHAVAAGSGEALRRICRRLLRVDPAGDADPSAFIRGALLREIACRLGCRVRELSVVRSSNGPGAPQVFYCGEPLAAGISVSHDGLWAAFALDPAALVPSYPSG